MSTQPIIAYRRVSTQKQGRSGLGAEAQKEAVDRFCQLHGFDIRGWHEGCSRTPQRTSRGA
jgi:DNA invertase Pin-like site-specific DNA recombinase